MTTALLTPPTKLAAAGRAIGDPGQVSALLPTAAGEFVLYGSPEQNPTVPVDRRLRRRPYRCP